MGLHHSGVALFAKLGILARCASEDVAARAVAVTGYDPFLRRNSGMDFTSYIDDTGVHVAGNDRDVVA